MATRRRDISPKKDKAGKSLPLNRPTTTSNLPLKTSSSRTPLRPTSTVEPRKQTMIKKPTPVNSTPRRIFDKTPLVRVPTKPSPQPRQTTTLSARKTPVSTAPSLLSRVKTPLPVQKTRVSTQKTNDKTPLPARKTAVPLPKKSSVAPKKTAVDKKSKAANVSLHETPVNTTSKMSDKQTENETIAASTTKEETEESLSMYQNLPEAETVLLQDQEIDTFFLNQETQTAEVVEDEEHVTKADSVQEKPLEIVTTIVLESEEKELVEEKTEEHSVTLANDYHKEEEKVEAIEKEKALDENEETAAQTEVVETKEAEIVEEQNQKSEPMETKEAEKVQEHNQKSESRAQKQDQKSESRIQNQGFPIKKESAVSNDAIEETANKLREQRKSRVRALAGAFESVMQ